VFHPQREAAMSEMFVSVEDAYRQYIDVMFRIEDAGDNHDRNEVLEVLQLLHTPGLMSVEERDTLTCHLLTTSQNGEMDEDAKKDIAKTVMFLSGN
jgi:hypothetical protein